VPSSSTTRYEAKRDLAITLIGRELVVRYKRSVLGVLWALIEPLANVAVYVVVFGIFLDAGRDATRDYAVFALWGVLPWLFLSSTLEQSTGTLLEHAQLLKKSAFPRELLIGAVVVSRLTTLLLGVLVAIAFGFVRGVPLGAADVGLVALGTAAMTIIAFGAGLVFASLQVLLRDVLFLVRFALRLGFYACPIVYPLTRIHGGLRDVYELNPLVSLFWCFQSSALTDAARPSTASFASGAVVVLACGVGGYALYRRLASAVADRL
jgi:ABC-type polysaccharide/polyol phosphate export permease